MKIKVHGKKDILENYISGSLTYKMMQEVEKHSMVCKECSSKLTAMRKISEILNLHPHFFEHITINKPKFKKVKIKTPKNIKSQLPPKNVDWDNLIKSHGLQEFFGMNKDSIDTQNAEDTIEEEDKSQEVNKKSYKPS